MPEPVGERLGGCKEQLHDIWEQINLRRLVTSRVGCWYTMFLTCLQMILHAACTLYIPTVDHGGLCSNDSSVPTTWPMIA